MLRLLLSFSVTTVLAASASQASEITLVDAAKMTWKETPEGVAFAPLDGNRFEEPYQAMVRLPAGIVSPVHVKSANMFGVILQGKMAHYSTGDDPNTTQVIGAGSFYKIPRDLAHVSACVSEIPCIAYLYQDGAFDFVPVKP